MKFRKSFVTNSSSSSFVCDYCGEDVSGWDLGLKEAQMFECEHGHVFCENHAVKAINEKEMLISLLNTYIERSGDSSYADMARESLDAILKGSISELDYEELLDDYDYRYDIPSEYCPICQFKRVTNEDMLEYIFRQYNFNRNDLVEEIKQQFSSYKEFNAFKKEK